MPRRRIDKEKLREQEGKVRREVFKSVLSLENLKIPRLGLDFLVRFVSRQNEQIKRKYN